MGRLTGAALPCRTWVSRTLKFRRDTCITAGRDMCITAWRRTRKLRPSGMPAVGGCNRTCLKRLQVQCICSQLYGRGTGARQAVMSTASAAVHNTPFPKHHLADGTGSSDPDQAEALINFRCVGGFEAGCAPGISQ